MAALLVGQPRRVQEIVFTTVMDESSFSSSQMDKGDISSATGQQSSSRGPFQQTIGWNSDPAARRDLATSLGMFLHGGVNPGTDGLYAKDWQNPAVSVPELCQQVQGSQFDGHTNWPGQGVLPRAQNYIDAYPAAMEMLDLEGTHTVTDIRDLADVLRAAGIANVIELDGWKSTGETDGPFDPIGILLHHDAMGFGENSDPSDDMNVPSYMRQNGVGGSQLWLRADGAAVLMAAGRKWHAGLGRGWGDVPANSGNSRMLGIETDYSGTGPWPDALMQTIYRASAAIKQHYGFSTSNCCGHREYAPDRKVDPANFDLDLWRARLNMDLHGSNNSPTSTPPETPPTPAPFPWPPKPVTPTPEEDDMYSDADRARDVQAAKDLASIKSILTTLAPNMQHLWDWTSNTSTGIAARVKGIARKLGVGDGPA